MAALDPKKVKKLNEIGRKDILLSAVSAGEPGRFFAGSSNAKVYDLTINAKEKDVEEKELPGHESYVTGVAKTGDVVVSGSYDGSLIWWNAGTHEKVRAVEAHQRWIRGVTASPDGKTIASVADDMVCRLWDASTGKLKHELKGHAAQTPTHYPSMLYCCAISGDSKHVATADRVGQVIVWEIATGKQAATFEVPVMYTWDPRQRRHSIGGIRSLAFSPDSKSLAIGGMGQVGNIDHLGAEARLSIYDWQKQEETHEFKSGNHKGLVEQIAFSAKGDWLVLGGGANAGFLIFYDLGAKKEIINTAASMHVHAMHVDEEAATIYTLGHNKITIFQA